MFLYLEEGEVKVTDQGMDQPSVQRLYATDKKKGKPFFKEAIKFIFYVYSKDSIYNNYLPHQRELKVIEVMFPKRNVNHFLKNTSIKTVITAYVDMSYTFKEKLYRRLLSDIEEMLDRVSKVPLQKKTKVQTKRDITFYSKEVGKEVTQNVDINAIVVIDNSEEKIKAMDVLEKLLRREVILKKQLKEEEINLKMLSKSGARLYDN